MCARSPENVKRPANATTPWSLVIQGRPGPPVDTLRVRNGSGTGSMGRHYGSENGARHRAHGRARFTRTTRDNAEARTEPALARTTDFHRIN